MPRNRRVKHGRAALFETALRIMRRYELSVRISSGLKSLFIDQILVFYVCVFQ